MVAVFGTMAAGVLHVEFRVPDIASTVLFAVLLALVFWTWLRTEPTISIHSITTARRELFYWAAVLATFAMGTALGDLAAYTLNLGFLSAGIVFAVLFGLPAQARAADAGGIGIGDGTMAFVLAALIVAGVVYLTISRADQREPARQAGYEPTPALADERPWLVTAAFP